MRRHPPLPALLLAASAFALSACRDGSSGGGPAATVTNLGLSVESMMGEGSLWVVAVLEAQEGGRDLNGDGDDFDQVLHVYDTQDGSLRNLALGLARTANPRPGGQPYLVTVGTVLIAFGVAEDAQGEIDLNGDGDSDDVVLQVYNAATGVVTSTGLAAASIPPAIGLGAVAFVVSEADQGGMDLDGNGSATDLVLHVFDSRTGLSTNALRNVTSNEIVFQDHNFAFTTDEGAAGADLNGDGDMLDSSIFELYDFFIGGIVSVPLAIRGRLLGVGFNDWFALADENDTGMDLNGDLDTADGVYQRIDPNGPTFQSLGLSGLASFGSEVDGTDLGLVVQEIDGLDRNGDGDLFDWVVVLYDVLRSQSHDSGLAIDPNAVLVFAGDRLVFPVSEGFQGLDLDGDGDQTGQVLHTVKRMSGLVENLGLDVVALQAGDELALFSRLESATGDDWNGDGDQNDSVTFYWDATTASLTNTALAGVSSVVASTSEWLLLIGVELDEGEDLNADGDMDDFVYVLHNVVTGTNGNLGLATNTLEAGLDDQGHGLLLVSERSQGLDLNGDGDLSDRVLHRLELP